jgi:hypothetical protein
MLSTAGLPEPPLYGTLSVPVLVLLFARLKLTEIVHVAPEALVPVHGVEVGLPSVYGVGLATLPPAVLATAGDPKVTDAPLTVIVSVLMTVPLPPLPKSSV